MIYLQKKCFIVTPFTYELAEKTHTIAYLNSYLSLAIVINSNNTYKYIYRLLQRFTSARAEAKPQAKLYCYAIALLF